MPKSGPASYVATIPAILAWVAVLFVGQAALSLSGQSSIVYGADEDFPPFEWVSRDGTLQGFNIDLMREIATSTGIEVKFVHGPWADIRKMQWEGVVDVISMFKSEERETSLAFSDPLTVGYDTIWIRKGDPEVRQLGDLAGKGVLVQQTGFTGEFLARTLPNARVIYVESEPQALIALDNGRGDAAIVSELTARTAINTLRLNRIRKTGSPIMPRPLAFTTTFDKAPILDDLNSAMALLRADGRYAQLETAWLDAPREYTGVQAFFKSYGKITLIVFICVVFWLSAWALVLRRRVASRTMALQAELRERKKTEEELRRSQEIFNIIFTYNPVMMSLSNRGDGRYIEVNPAVVETTGYSRGELIGRTSTELGLWADESDRQAVMTQIQEHGNCTNYPVSIRLKNGRVIECIMNMNRVIINGDQIALTTVNDISNLRAAEKEKARLENQLRQVQKIEMAGRLAGGVAHDFNNQLTIIRGYCDILSRRLSSAADAGILDEIRKAVNHSSSLTSSLLAFSRRQVRRLEVLEPSGILRDMEQAIRVTLGENLTLDLQTVEPVSPIEMDRGQLVEVIYNIVANARDAMGTSGTLTIRVENVTVPPGRHVSMVEMTPGDYVQISLVDDGVGMSEETLKLLFEPFYTTKEVGKGIGLGLATVYGIIKQNSGYIDVVSRMGEGTTVTLFIPAFKAQHNSAAAPQKPGEPSTGNETVLLAEDEKGLFTLLNDVLKAAGYKVLAAERPSDAIEMARHCTPDILVTDVVMPEMSGKELAAQIRAMHPGLKILYMSGYPRDTISAHGILSSDVDLLNKPFSLEEFQRTVRRVLDS